MIWDIVWCVVSEVMARADIGSAEPQEPISLAKIITVDMPLKRSFPGRMDPASPATMSRTS